MTSAPDSICAKLPLDRDEVKFAAAKFGVLNYVPVGCCLLRRDFTVLFWNQCLENWTNISESNIIGTDLREHFPKINQPKYQIRLQQVFEAGFPAIFSPQLHQSLIPASLSGGGERIQQTTVTAVPTLKENGFYALVAAQDVTDLTHRVEIYQEELRERKRAQAELQRSNSELEQFAYVASHDLREPLRMVTTFTQLLAQQYSNELDDQAQEIIAFAVDGATRMRHLVDGLLKFSRVGTQGNEFQLHDCNDVLDIVLNDLQLAIQESKAQIKIYPLPSIIGDEAQLFQLFQNLIGNAIKYRSKQTPQIEIGANRTEAGWEFWIQDNGIGFNQNYAERIFLIFQRLHTRQEFSGTGIGLAVCKKIVERHGGQIWVRSKLDQGSTFYFTLPDESDQAKVQSG